MFHYGFPPSRTAVKLIYCSQYHYTPGNQPGSWGNRNTYIPTYSDNTLTFPSIRVIWQMFSITSPKTKTWFVVTFGQTAEFWSSQICDPQAVSTNARISSSTCACIHANVRLMAHSCWTSDFTIYNLSGLHSPGHIFEKLSSRKSLIEQRQAL